MPRQRTACPIVAAVPRTQSRPSSLCRFAEKRVASVSNVARVRRHRNPLTIDAFGRVHTSSPAFRREDGGRRRKLAARRFRHIVSGLRSITWSGVALACGGSPAASGGASPALFVFSSHGALLRGSPPSAWPAPS